MKIKIQIRSQNRGPQLINFETEKITRLTTQGCFDHLLFDPL